MKAHGIGMRHLQAFLMALSATIISVIRNSMGVAVLEMTDQTNVNNTTVTVYQWSEQICSVVLSSFFWGYTIMQVPGGILATRFGGKPMLFSALIINGVLCLVTPVLAAFGGWIAVCMVRITMGLTQACFIPSVYAILGRWAPPSERTRLGVVVYTALPFFAAWVFIQAIAGLLNDYFYNNKILSLSNCRKLFNAIGCVGAASGLIAMSFVTSEYTLTAIIVMTLSGGILGSCACGYTLNHIDLSPNFGGIMFGITNCSANLIGILAPLSTGFILGDHLIDIVRWRIVFFLAASLIVFGDLIYRCFGTSEKQAWNDPKPDYELAQDKTMKNSTEQKVQEVMCNFK